MAWWLLQHLVVTAALALGVLALSRLVRLGPVTRHALWLLVLVKFVVPPVVAWPWAVPDPLGIASGGGPAAASELEAEGERSASVAEPDRPTDQFSAGGQSAAVLAAPALRPWSWIASIWIGGCVLLLLVEGVRFLRVRRRVRASVPADLALTSRAARLSSVLGIGPVEIRVVPGSAPPSVWTFGRTQVLWPADLPAGLSDACVDGLLLHELAHVKRRDHLVGWVELVAGVVWWWNPLFWYVRSALREQAELACDAWVISALPNGRRAYAESLLTLSGAAVRGTPSMALVGIRPTGRRMLERRLVMIMKGRAPVQLSRVGLFCLALLAAVTLPGWAAAQDPPPPPPDPPVRVPVVTVVPRPTAPVVVAPEQAPPPPRPIVVATPRQAPPPVAVVPPSAPRRSGTPLPPPAPVRPEAMPVVVAPPAVPQAGARLQRRRRLPADGQALVEQFNADRDEIQRTADQRIAERRQVLIQALQALQDQYTRAGQLDEAVAIRDLIQSLSSGGRTR